ncbi:MAG: hypothetical protein DCC49_06545 [Acidobacteria bacterium]|nr:MAG: hypothetical protein DCC49_06545 [Acidobacteriota bacterium]
MNLDRGRKLVAGSVGRHQVAENTRTCAALVFALLSAADVWRIRGGRALGDPPASPGNLLGTRVLIGVVSEYDLAAQNATLDPRVAGHIEPPAVIVY